MEWGELATLAGRLKKKRDVGTGDEGAMAMEAAAFSEAHSSSSALYLDAQAFTTSSRIGLRFLYAGASSRAGFAADLQPYCRARVIISESLGFVVYQN
jgi:hypothetical protein